MQSWIKVASVCMGGPLIGLILRVVVPAGWGLGILRPHAVLFLRANRLAFWGALIAGLVIVMALIPRAMMKDIVP
jgi:hypothetical protein